MARDTGAARSRPPTRVIAVVAAAVVAVVGAVIIITTHHPAAPPPVSVRPPGIPSNVSTNVAAIMGLGQSSTAPAPNFTLVDQQGHRLSLASFRGRAVVLEFMDPHCTDICPIVSQEFVDAYHDLGTTARHVVFLAVNVNPYHEAVTDVASFSRAHGLDAIPSWHFFTGPTSALKRIWSDYGITVRTRGRNADVIHTSLIYFIDPSGHERYLASPTDEHTKSGKAFLPAPMLTTWGHGIARVASDLAS